MDSFSENLSDIKDPDENNSKLCFCPNVLIVDDN
jgi:hypothetical protein